MTHLSFLNIKLVSHGKLASDVIDRLRGELPDSPLLAELDYACDQIDLTSELKPFPREGASVHFLHSQICYISRPDHILWEVPSESASCAVDFSSRTISISGPIDTVSGLARSGILLLLAGLLEKKEIVGLHASSVISEDRCALLAGDTGSGKSTLAYILSQEMDFFVANDDDTLIDITSTPGRLIPFQTPLRIDRGIAERFPDIGRRHLSTVTLQGRERLLVPVTPMDTQEKHRITDLFFLTRRAIRLGRIQESTLDETALDTLVAGHLAPLDSRYNYSRASRNLFKERLKSAFAGVRTFSVGVGDDFQQVAREIALTMKG